MANLLLVDSDGRRRTRLDVAAQTAGHKTYAAGSADEAIRMATIYVPEAVLMPGGLADPAVAGLVTYLRGNADRKLQHMVLVTPDRTPRPDAPRRTAIARSAQPDALLAAVDEVLDSEDVGVKG